LITLFVRCAGETLASLTAAMRGGADAAALRCGRVRLRFLFTLQRRRIIFSPLLQCEVRFFGQLP
jgi:hypothetical protein